MNSFYAYILSKIRNIRYSVTTGFSQRTFVFGTIVSGHYRNYKRDPNPLVFIMYSDNRYTHGINLHYLDSNELNWFNRNLFMIKKYQQMIDGRTFYQFLKTRMPSIPKKAYRVYFTNMCDYKIISSGITNMEKFCYPSNEPYIVNLNKLLSPQAISAPPTQVAYSTTELRERIIESQNSINLYK